MPKITLRRGVWSGIALLAVIVLPISFSVIFKPPPVPSSQVSEPSKYDVAGDLRRAKGLPEWSELTKLIAKENRPLTSDGLARAGELTRHPNMHIQILALGTLAHSPSKLRPEAAALVAAQIKNENEFVRSEAILILGRLGIREFEPVLLDLAHSSNSNDRSQARNALKLLGRPVE
jgi:hypothetical protein